VKFVKELSWQVALSNSQRHELPLPAGNPTLVMLLIEDANYIE
jgi:hypothetical protein